MPSLLRSLGLAPAFLLGGEAAAQQPEPWQMGFQQAATPVMETMTGFHTFLLVIVTAIVLLVTILLGWCMFRYSAKRNPTASRTTHNSAIEVIWTVLPVLVLVAIAIPSFRLLYEQQVVPPADLTVKATGHQWYWTYEYPDQEAISFDSNPIAEKDLKPGQPRLLAVDNEMVVPVNKVVRLISTSDDVLHSWAMPAFGVKIDSVPGRLNEAWFRATKTGVYYGQCSELCGRNHSFMPIAVRVVPEADFKAWVAQRKANAAAPSTRRVAAR